MVKILVFGSSETWGAFDTEKGGWVERLKIYFLNKRQDVKAYVYNFGVSSDDSEGLLFRLKTQIEIIEKIGPDEYIFIFSIGKNDACYFKEKINKKVLLEKYKKNIKKIIFIARRYSDKVLFIGLPEIDDSKTTPWNEEGQEFYENDDLKKYDKKLKEVCEIEKVHCISIRDLLSKKDLHDGLHPNSEGHRKIFERVKDYLNANVIN